MDSQTAQSSAADDPADAFEALRGEVSLLRRAVEGLTAERQNVPDYTATLDATAKRLHEIGAFMRVIADRPAMRLTPASLAAEITNTSADVRVEDRKLIELARCTIDQKTGELDALVARVRSAERQKIQILYVACLTALVSSLVWMIFPGVVARSLPTSWHVPEKIAARLMRRDMRDAGLRLIVEGRRHAASTATESTEAPALSGERKVNRPVNPTGR